VRNISFIVITYNPSFHAFLMLTIDQFLTIFLPLSFMVMSNTLINR
jgi:hypothetical protein